MIFCGCKPFESEAVSYLSCFANSVRPGRFCKCSDPKPAVGNVYWLFYLAKYDGCQKTVPEAVQAL